MVRFRPIDRADMYPEQRRVADLVHARRQGGRAGPFVSLTYVPGILDRFQLLGEHCRFHTSLSPKLRQFVILLTARHVGAPFEFHTHSGLSRRLGVTDVTIAALAANERPSDLDDEQAVAFEFCTAMLRDGRVDTDTFGRTEAVLGRKGVLDLVSVYGYYRTLGMVLNVTDEPLPADAAPPFTVPEG